MSIHPASALTIADLGIDYLIDRTRADRAEHGFDDDLVTSGDRPAVNEQLRRRLHAAALVSEDAAWRKEIDSLVRGGPGGSAALGEMVLRRERGRPFDPTQPLAAQLTPDAQAVLDVLAIERQLSIAAQGDIGVPLAAALRPRPTVPPRAPFRPGAVEVVEIGDLGDPFSCRAHTQVYEELGELRQEVSWRWLYCATPRSLPASHRAGAIAEQVLALAPEGFWPVIGTFATNGPDDGSEHAQAVLAAVGVDPALGRPPPDGTPLPAGLLDDRTMATVCGLPQLRPLFAIGRTLFAGTDAASRLRDVIRAGGQV